MTQLSYRANLTAIEFPMLSDYQGQNVIIPDIDQNNTRPNNQFIADETARGIAQIYYCHNVIPIAAGITSVGYETQLQPPIPLDSTFSQIFQVRDTAENVAFIAITTSGKVFAWRQIDSAWNQTTVGIAPAPGKFVSTAHVNGQTYIFFGGFGCFKYDYAFNQLLPVTLTGLNNANINGITAASGYMIAWTDTSVAWSSVVDPTDFVPSLITGAGGGGVQQAKAAIVACTPINTGFFIGTKRNFVVALYTGNPQYPFTFKEVNGSGGLSSLEHISYNGNNNSQYAYTTAGFQEIGQQAANVVFPQITDFMGGYRFEDFDSGTKQLYSIPLSEAMVKKITVVSNRYFVISYGVTSLTHALVYDIGLGRWGKLKIPHVDCFEFIFPATQNVDAPKRSVGFLQADGTVQTLVISNDTGNSDGVVIAGKYQLDRNSYLSIQEIHLESAQFPMNPEVTVLSAFDGSNTHLVPTSLQVSTGTYRRYNCRSTAKNHSIIFTGAFQLHTLVLKLIPEGAVR